MTVSISERTNIDLQTILAGGDAFTARLQHFREAAQAAEEAKAIRQEAYALKATAEAQIAENQKAAEQLRIAQEAAEHERAKFAAKYDALLAAARD